MSDTGFSEKKERNRPLISRTDRTDFLARALENRGVPLEMCWREALPRLLVRTCNVLAASGYDTLADVLQALRNDGKELMLKKNFGQRSLRDLWDAIEELAGTRANDYESSLSGETRGIGQFQSEYLLSRLEAAGVDPNQPWQNLLLPVVTIRLRNVLDRQFVTLREVAVAATDEIDSLRKTWSFGRTSERELLELLEKLAEHGADYVRYGDEVAPPATVGKLIAQALRLLPAQDGRLLVRRFLEGATLEQLGRERGLTRERIRQLVNKTLLRLHIRLGEAARELTGPLVEAINQSGGLLHRETALKMTAARDLPHVWLALLIAGAESFHIWREEFLTTLKMDELSKALHAIRRCFRENRKRDLSLSDAGELITLASGFRLDAAGLTCLLTAYLECGITEDGMVVLPGIRVSERLEKILRAAGRPMHVSEITDLYLASGVEEIAALDEDDANPTATEAGRRNLAERAVAAAISRCEDVYQYSPKTFVHANAFPIPLQSLNEIADFCIARLEGKPEAVTDDFLMGMVVGAGLDHEGLNKFLLKDALSRRSQVVSLRGLRVTHAPGIKNTGEID